MDFVYIEKKTEISIDLDKLQKNGNELGQLIQKNSQELEEIAVADILNFIAQDAANQHLRSEVYTVSLSNGTALDDFGAEFFAQPAVKIEGALEYSAGKIIFKESFETAKITFSTEKAELALTLRNYVKPEKKLTYAFHGVGDTGSVAGILSEIGIVSSYSIVAVSDETAVTVDGDTLTALSFFDEVTLTVTLEDESIVVVTLANSEFIPANQTVQNEAGTFTAAVDLPVGAELKVTDAEVNESVVEQAKAALGEEAQVLFYDISIVDADKNEIETGATVNLNLGIDLPIPDGEMAKVTGYVYHVTEDGLAEQLDAKFTLNEKGIKSVTFSTEGFSVFGIAYTVELIEINKNNGVINLDFTGYEPYPAEETDVAFPYDTEECNIRVSVERVLDIALAAEASGDGVSTEKYSAENFEIDLTNLSVVSSEGGVLFEEGMLIITADGAIELTDEEKTLTIHISGITKLREEILKVEGVEIQVEEGNIPLGSQAQYTAHTEEETAQLVEQYELTIPEGEGSGFSSADLKIVRNEEEVNAEGQFKVTIEKSSLIPEGMKLEKLYHIHDGKAEEVTVTENEEGKLEFEVANFSDFVASYTVDFEFNGQTYTLAGYGQILLSELLAALNTGYTISDVDNVTFTDTSLISLKKVERDTTVYQLYLEQFGYDGGVSDGDAIINGTDTSGFDRPVQAGDWILTSLKPFTEEQTLTIWLRNGLYFSIKVTDPVSDPTNGVWYLDDQDAVAPGDLSYSVNSTITETL